MTPSSAEPFMFGTAEMTSSSAPHESANAAAISNAFRPHLDSSEPTGHLGDGVVQVHQVALRSSVYGTTTIGQYAYAGRLELVVPSSRSARPPLPRLPMTMRL